MFDFEMSAPPKGSNSISVNNGNISYKNNSVTVHGSARNISTGDYATFQDNSRSEIDWDGLQSDVIELYKEAARSSDNGLRENLSDTADALQTAVDKKDESSVQSVLSRVAEGTLDFIKTLGLQVLPSLILKKFG